MIDSETQAYINRIIDIKIAEHEAKKDPIEEFNKLLENPRVQDVFNRMIDSRVKEELERAEDGIKEIVKEELDTSFDNRLITSDLEVLPRLRATEKVTGIYKFEDFEEHEPTIPEQIKELTERLEQPLNKSTESIKLELPIVPETTLEHKAYAIVEHLKEKVKPRNDAIFMNSNEIINFLKSELPEDLRLKEDIRNPRQAKKDILEKAIKLFSNSVQIIRNKSGNKVTGIALKPSVWRTDTYGC